MEGQFAIDSAAAGADTDEISGLELLDRLYFGAAGHRHLYHPRWLSRRGLYRVGANGDLDCRFGARTYYGLEAIGGWGELKATIGGDKFNLWKPLVPAGIEGTWDPVEVVNESGDIIKKAWYFGFPGHYPWLGMLFCAPIIGLWYWCTDQYIVQRALGAPNETEARRGSIFAGCLKLLPVFIFIVPGMICWGLILKTSAPALADAHPALAAMDFSEVIAEPVDGKPKIAESGKAFPMMVKNVLPTGVRGIVVAGLLSALMSSLAGVFNACSTLFTMDLYAKYRPGASESQLVKIGRIATIIMVLIGLAWIPVIQGSRGLYDYLQSVQGYLAPPIFVVFFLGIFWKRLNAEGCLAALIVGFALGVFRLAIDTPIKIYDDFAYTEGSLLWIINKIYFQYFSLLIFLISTAVMISVSYLTRAPDYGQISGLTYGTITEEHIKESRDSWSTWDAVASVALLIGILGAYLYFRG
jgi:SSS family solute:Na+ symporter